MVSGQDMSTINSGMKIVATDDLKVVSIMDFKRVFLDAKTCNFFYEIKGLDLQLAQNKIGNRNLVMHRGNIAAKLEDMRTTITDADITI
jgi:hypothetical protein